MKKFALRTVLLITSVIVFLTGTGVTIVNYCCSGCTVEQTLVVTKAHSCCSSTDDKQYSCCNHSETQERDGCSVENGNHCKASRISTDIDASAYRPHIASPFVWISDTPITHLVALDQFENSDIYIKFESPPKIPPRDYLSLIRVLVI